MNDRKAILVGHRVMEDGGLAVLYVDWDHDLDTTRFTLCNQYNGEDKWFHYRIPKGIAEREYLHHKDFIRKS